MACAGSLPSGWLVMAGAFLCGCPGEFSFHF
jgi:hypothetical protein